MKQGVVFDVEEFTVYDGPGLRQTVFFKGCPMRCTWCHNPEGLCRNPQLMVGTASCIHCGECRKVCRHESCAGCGDCIPVCPLGLRRIVGESISSDELVNRIRKNSNFYSQYGGGVTFSGGEPLMQAEFLLDVLGELTDVHRAVETSGYCENAVFEQVLDSLDYMMMDIKIFDPDLHRRYTGVNNRKILENAHILCRGETPFVIRIPLIPGVNDTEENFKNTAKWLEGAKALEKVELLPYHKTAGAKYSMVGKEYKPEFDVNREVRVLEKIFREYGIRSEVL